MSWLTKISDSITTVLKGVRPPAPIIPPILLLCEILNRPGLSPISLTTSIITRLPEIGIPTEPNPDGSENNINLFVKVMCEEIVKEIQTNASVQIVIQPGALNITGVGEAAGIPAIPVTATNIGFSKIGGIIR